MDKVAARSRNKSRGSAKKRQRSGGTALRTRLIMLFAVVGGVIATFGTYGVRVYQDLFLNYVQLNEQFAGSEAVSQYREGLFRLVQGIEAYANGDQTVGLSRIQQGYRDTSIARETLHQCPHLDPLAVEALTHTEIRLREYATLVVDLSRAQMEAGAIGETEEVDQQILPTVMAAKALGEQLHLRLGGLDARTQQIIGLSRANIEHRQSIFTAVICLGVVLPICILVLLGILASLKISAPLEGLVQAVRQVSKGKLQLIPSDHRAPSEIMELTEAYNEMILSLDQHTVSRKWVGRVLDALPVLVFICSREGRVTYLNQHAGKVLGVSAGDLNGRLIQACFEEKELPLKVWSSDGESRELNLLCKDGSKLSVLAAVSAIEQDRLLEQGGDDSESGTWLLAAADITGQKNLETDLREATAEATRANHAKSEFLANMSHEIRTPLNAVLGLLQLLVQNDLDAEQQEFAEAAENSARSLLDIINDVLDLAKIESGKLEIHNEDFNLYQMVEQTARPLSFQAEQKDLHLTLEIDSDLKEPVIGDEVRIRQVLVNLVGNAIKFTQEGQVDLTVRVVAESPSYQTVRFSVADTGIGIEESRLNRIFEVFEQGDSSVTKEFGGTGLGLAISSHLVHRLGGKLLVDSAPGEGSVFAFTLKLRRAEMSAPISVGTGENLEVEGSRRPGYRVLLAEDNPANQLIARTALERRGYSVDVVVCGRTAVEAARKSVYDLILMDLQMPGMSGLEAAEAIRRSEANQEVQEQVPIVALTAHAFSEVEAQCRDVGMDDFMRKPFDLEDLIKVVRHHTGLVDDTAGLPS